MTKLITKLRNATAKRLKEMEELIITPDNAVWAKLLELDSMVCYILFRHTNDDLDALENLHSMVINGFYDDAEFHVRKQVNSIATDMNERFAEHLSTEPETIYEYVLDYSTALEDESRQVSESQILELMEANQEAANYYKTNKQAIEEGSLFDKGDEYHIWRNLEKVAENIMQSTYEQNLWSNK